MCVCVCVSDTVQLFFLNSTISSPEHEAEKKSDRCEQTDQREEKRTGRNKEEERKQGHTGGEKDSEKRVRGHKIKTQLAGKKVEVLCILNRLKTEGENGARGEENMYLKPK